MTTLQTPTQPYRVIVADPPWSFNDKLPGDTRGAEKQYQVLGLEGVCNFEDFHKQPIADDAVLFLWRVSSQVQNAYKVVNAWGFKEHSELVWDKLTVTGKEWFGMGRIVRGAHESCIIATRGKGASLVKSKSIRSRFGAQVGKHSEKPEEFYKIVETLFDGPYLELFARKLRPGWTTLGNEVPHVHTEEEIQANIELMVSALEGVELTHICPQCSALKGANEKVCGACAVSNSLIETKPCLPECMSDHKVCPACGDVCHKGNNLCKDCTELQVEEAMT